MNFNRGRNIFTLGNFQLASRYAAKRSQSRDPFERDPFKIQSYNFRYADRPSLPISAVQPRVINQPESLQNCQTYFYNNNFSACNNSNGQTKFSLANDDRTLNLSKFQEYRRRKFLQKPGPNKSRFQQTDDLMRKPYESKILNLYYGNKEIPTTSCQNNYYALNNPNCDIAKNSSQFSVRNCYKSDDAKTSTSYKPPFLSPVDVGPNRRSSSSSGCEININIKSLENNSSQDQVNINIETDSVYKNLNIPQTKKSNDYGQLKNNLSSSESFVIDKRLSKFSVKPETKQDLRMTSKDRVKQLTSIYRLNSKIPKKSDERFPTLIPLKTNSPRTNRNSSFCSKGNLFQGVKDNVSSYDCKTKSKGSSYSNNNAYRNPYNISLNSRPFEVKPTFSNNYYKSGQSPLESSIYGLHSAANRGDLRPMVPLGMRSNTKLPFNVNINVFADKLKLLKI